VTDQNARVHEHVEYFPYGAVWRDPRSDVGASPVKGQRFLFTGKELDEETGLYYFGARYYDPVRVRWASPDPILHAYLDGAPSGGVLYPVNLALYGYSAYSPLTFKDLDGLATTFFQELRAAASGEASGAFAGLIMLIPGVSVTDIDKMEKNIGSVLYPNEPQLAANFQAGFNTGYILGAYTGVAAAFSKSGGGAKGSGESTRPGVQKPPVPAPRPMAGRRLGHTFTKHGAANTKQLIMEAKGSGRSVGQWVDEAAAEKFIAERLGELKNGAKTFDLPEGLGRIIHPDGQ
jgi:RHS repeat-associated protein